MNFLGVSLHSPEIGVCQLKVYGDIQSHQGRGTEQLYLNSLYFLLQNDKQLIQYLLFNPRFAHS